MGSSTSIRDPPLEHSPLSKSKDFKLTAKTRCFRKVVPSFALLDVQSDVIVAYLYRLIDDDVKVERVQFKKNRATD
jgi:hypothetical protein